MQNHPDDEPIPKTAFWLGTGGLLPFVALSSALWALGAEFIPVLLFWLIAYGAVILSFIGAVHWGAALLHPRMPAADRSTHMTWSVVPALVAWLALILPAQTGLLLLAASYVIEYAADYQLNQRFGLPRWYLKLRAGLTSVVVLCLLLALARVLYD